MRDDERLAEVVAMAIKAATAPLLARVIVLERQSLAVPKDGHDGEPGPPGPPGKDADQALVLALKSELEGVKAELRALKEPVLPPLDIPACVKAEVMAAVAAIPVPKDGAPGQSVDRAEVEALVKAAVDATPRPQDGRSVTVEDVAPLIDRAVKAAVDALPKAKDGISVADALIDHDGQLVQTFSDGRTKSVGHVKGRDVDMAFVAQRISEEVAKIPIPVNGKDGVGFDDFDFVYDDYGQLTLTLLKGEQSKAAVVPSFVDRGVWREGEVYRKGHGVTFGGSFFIAQRDNPGKPETDDGWRLAVKRGRDGRNGRDAAGPVKLG